ncbi:SPOR domain-containing protein [Sulfitobacter pseudonitzschiae]|uniref:SPOR domain-containing protein n=1 Tax=Pseudosulfitobacter pseudonitzschiae TaxID=1402135 RepID=A0A9Q2NNT0_9RHOB|nr:SPOR domain-containing protein [Pseudosulfitobacter pseudonitzschiae]MBM2294126.1 SPOR domain-containing protein [Pseudosulfitobacter pseudonitzschiae]MBM2299050.1 SPOR domain-containing protein [Pseudosulfitobacter pseudonitzschiae]MBM2303958.1 SPOR domain-containing protein [Pseudosulfitobacter pseudonitzschiae]MBM2313739.1 SPOR domain-containing protein [Pseudosulfitobacter pseudonitzschiae]MBM2318654.1 SPOR domain-containing protein [Pseudosulfitobacter pseudonitzschiae]
MTWAVFSRNFRSHTKGLIAATCALAVLAGCDEGGQFSLGQGLGIKAKDGTTTSATKRTRKTVERDIEAPEVFSATEPGLWDGRPSLGGVWVAHPDVKDPERVIIRNQANGQFVVGALFRRERHIPGPRLQVSSDAATSLGMLAGAPVELNVTALRKEEIAEDGPVEEATLAADGAALPPAADVAATTLDPVSTAETALADPATPATAPPPAPKPVAQPRASSLDKPYVQIGIFSVEANAERTANQMRGAGVVPEVKTFEANGKTFWRVVVGPAVTASERKQLLAKIKEQGFSDAYAVTN